MQAMWRAENDSRRTSKVRMICNEAVVEVVCFNTGVLISP